MKYFLSVCLFLPLLGWTQHPWSLEPGFEIRDQSRGTFLDVGYRPAAAPYRLHLRMDYTNFKWSDRLQQDYLTATGTGFGIELGGEFNAAPIRAWVRHHKRWLFRGGVYYRYYNGLHFSNRAFEYYVPLEGLAEVLGAIFGVSEAGVNPYYQTLRGKHTAVGAYLGVGEEFRINKRINLVWRVHTYFPFTSYDPPSDYWRQQLPSFLRHWSVDGQVGVRYYCTPPVWRERVFSKRALRRRARRAKRTPKKRYGAPERWRQRHGRSNNN